MVRGFAKYRGWREGHGEIGGEVQIKSGKWKGCEWRRLKSFSAQTIMRDLGEEVDGKEHKPEWGQLMLEMGLEKSRETWFFNLGKWHTYVFWEPICPVMAWEKSRFKNTPNLLIYYQAHARNHAQPIGDPNWPKNGSDTGVLKVRTQNFWW